MKHSFIETGGDYTRYLSGCLFVGGDMQSAGHVIVGADTTDLLYCALD